MSSSSSSPASVTSSSPSAEHAVAPTNPAQMVDLLVQSVQEDDVLFVLFYLSELGRNDQLGRIDHPHSYYSQSALLAAVSYDTLPRRLSAQLLLLHGADPRHDVCGLSAIEHAMLIGNEWALELMALSPRQLKTCAENDMPLAQALLDMPLREAEKWMDQTPDWLEAVDPYVFHARFPRGQPSHDDSPSPNPSQQPQNSAPDTLEEPREQSAPARPTFAPNLSIRRSVSSKKGRKQERERRPATGPTFDSRGRAISKPPKPGSSKRFGKSRPSLKEEPPQPSTLPIKPSCVSHSASPAPLTATARPLPDPSPFDREDDLEPLEALGLSAQELCAVVQVKNLQTSRSEDDYRAVLRFLQDSREA
ncbi:hypothetical protein JCM5296_000147 [Sporobolomyces johnsonii]